MIADGEIGRARVGSWLGCGPAGVAYRAYAVLARSAAKPARRTRHFIEALETLQHHAARRSASAVQANGRIAFGNHVGLESAGIRLGLIPRNLVQPVGSLESAAPLPRRAKSRSCVNQKALASTRQWRQPRPASMGDVADIAAELRPAFGDVVYFPVISA
jgi:hypothetical protein